MNSIEVNDKVVVVPADTVLEYLAYRKCDKELDKGWSEGLVEAMDMHAKNIMIWANNEPQFDDMLLSLTDLVPELEKIAIRYL